ncbi:MULTISPECIES: DUF2497 domain-containing protein [Roseomonadaceae]|nr:DUF2497 domain-containing protein [Roseomonas oleicola]
MDDILASIRRILNEDEAQEGQQQGGAAEPEPLDLTEAMLVAAPPPPPEPPVVAEEPEPEPEPQPEPEEIAAPVVPAPPLPPPVISAPVAVPPMAEVPPAAPAPSLDSLIAPAVAAATTATLASLLRSVAQERNAPVHRGGPSIEDVVREELRPLLKAWLDQHLPPLVERLVRVEIERVIGRAAP